MVFNSGWSKSDIEGLTYRELVEYVKEYYSLEAEKWFEFLKSFSIHNCESTAVATHGKKSDLNKYAASVRRRTLKVDIESDNHFDNQFREDE